MLIRTIFSIRRRTHSLYAQRNLLSLFSTVSSSIPVPNPPLTSTIGSSTCTIDKENEVPDKLCITNLSLQKFQDIYTSLGKSSQQATQIWQTIMQKSIYTPEQLKNELKFLTITELQEFTTMFYIRNPRIKIDKELISKDKTIKWLLQVKNYSNRKPSVEQSVISSPITDEFLSKDSSTIDLLPTVTKPSSIITPSSSSASAIEMVYIPEEGSMDNNGKYKAGRGTLCISSQIGCSLSCSFCHTGTQKMQGNLMIQEIIEQILISQERVKDIRIQHQERQTLALSTNPNNTKPSKRPFPPITNIVFMGQGEPLLNWRAVSTAIHIMTDPNGLNIPARRITISTSGIVPNIPRIAKETPGVRLAISLHAPTNTLRSQIMKINTQYNIQQLLEACQEYIDIRLQTISQQRKERAVKSNTNMDNNNDETTDTVSNLPYYKNDRYNNNNRIRISFEYTMLRNINDTPNHARLLAKLFKKYIKNPYAYVHVNLIPFNPWPNSPYQCSINNTIQDFQRILNVEGINTTIRRARGQDILGACGQLRSTTLSK